MFRDHIPGLDHCVCSTLYSVLLQYNITVHLYTKCLLKYTCYSIICPEDTGAVPVEFHM